MLPSLVVIGKNGAGKTTFTSYVTKKHPSYRSIATGHIFDEYAKESGMIEEGQELTNYQRTEVRIRAEREHGKDFPLQRLLQKLDPDHSYVIDGLRDIFGIDALKAYFERFGKEVVFVGIEADRERRLSRLVQNRGDTQDMFNRREELDGSRFRIDEMVERCDVVITNNYPDKAPFFEEIDHLMESLESTQITAV